MFLKKFAAAITIAISACALNACSGNDHRKEVDRCLKLWESKYAEFNIEKDFVFDKFTFEDYGYAKGLLTISAYDYGYEEDGAGTLTCSVDGAKVETADEDWE